MKQIKNMTTAEWRKGWTEVSIAFENNKSIDGWVCLCGAFNTVVGGALNIVGTMEDFRDGDLDSPPLWFNPTAKNQRIRATYAAMFAAMTPKEFLEICESGGQE